MANQPLVVHIPHQLGKKEAIRRLQRGFAHASAAAPVLTIAEETWSEDHLVFRLGAFGQTASGEAHVSDEDVRVEITLPWLLQRFAEIVGNSVKARTTILPEKR
jgi:hypothetical protein